MVELKELNLKFRYKTLTVRYETWQLLNNYRYRLESTMDDVINKLIKRHEKEKKENE